MEHGYFTRTKLVYPAAVNLIYNLRADKCVRIYANCPTNQIRERKCNHFYQTTQFDGFRFKAVLSSVHPSVGQGAIPYQVVVSHFLSYPCINITQGIICNQTMRNFAWFNKRKSHSILCAINFVVFPCQKEGKSCILLQYLWLMFHITVVVQDLPPDYAYFIIFSTFNFEPKKVGCTNM